MGQLPAWCSWVWFIIAAIGFPLGALAWILLVFWPYIQWSKRYMIEARKESNLQMGALRQTLHQELDATRGRLEYAFEKLADAQKVGIAVQVLCAIVPLFLKAVFDEGDRQGKLWR